MAGGQRRLEDLYAEYEGKSLMAFVFGGMAIIGLIVFLFAGIYIPAKQKKENQACDDLIAIARIANTFSKEHGAFPESLGDLQAFSEGNSVTEEEAFPRKDPWKREYRYFRVSDDRAAVVSGGRNRRIETTLDDLSGGAIDKAFEIKDENIFIYSPEEDDWIYVVGSWRIEGK